MKINYVVVCWSGVRRFMENSYDEDRTHFLKIQLQQLEKHKTSLSQITFIINHNPEEDDNYKQFINNIPKEINEVPVVILRRENEGQMFGAWFHVNNMYKEAFDYLFVTEDDYVPIHDNFDTIFLSAIEGKNNSGFMCPKTVESKLDRWEGKYGKFPERLSHIENYASKRKYNSVIVPIYVVGLIPTKCLSELFEKYGEFLYSETGYNEIDQGLIFYAMIAEGYTIDQLYGYSSYVLRHNHSKKKPWRVEQYGRGTAIFATTLYLKGK